MKKHEARAFVCAIADVLNLPSFVCEAIENKLIDEKYEEVVRYISQRYTEIRKPLFKTELETLSDGSVRYVTTGVKR